MKKLLQDQEEIKENEPLILVKMLIKHIHLNLKNKLSLSFELIHEFKLNTQTQNSISR
jgi:hypothetical protein